MNTPSRPWTRQSGCESCLSCRPPARISRRYFAAPDTDPSTGPTRPFPLWPLRASSKARVILGCLPAPASAPETLSKRRGDGRVAGGRRTPLLAGGQARDGPGSPHGVRCSPSAQATTASLVINPRSHVLARRLASSLVAKLSSAAKWCFRRGYAFTPSASSVPTASPRLSRASVGAASQTQFPG